MFKVEMLCTLL